MTQHIKAKLNYRPKSSLEVFYSGGAVSLCKTGLLACACQDDIKVHLPRSEMLGNPCFPPGQALVRLAADRRHPQWSCYQDSVWGEPRRVPFYCQFRFASALIAARMFADCIHMLEVLHAALYVA